VKVTIGIPVYNNANNVKNLVFALRSTAESLDNKAEIVILDDGSPNGAVAEDVRNFCERNGLAFIRRTANCGVPAAFNEITRRSSGEVVILLNDDIRPTEAGWFESIVQAFELNPAVGIVYWCQKQVDSSSGMPIRYTSDSKYLVESGIRHPLLRSNFCGAFFAFRKCMWRGIRQPDGSVGFWEDLLAYGEEIDFSSECHQQGRHILQLPIVWEHLQSQTFASHPAQRIRRTLSPYLDDQEFARISNEYLAGLGGSSCSGRRLRATASGSWLRMLGRADEGVSKLLYSLAMVIKKWENKAILGYPGRDYISHLMRDGFPTAIRDAISNGGCSVPGVFRYWDGISKSEVSVENCLADPNESLV
jgi:GT2 family glycosyltransferase